MKDHDALPLSDYIEYPQDEMKSRSADFYNDIKRRHTIRDFSDRDVPQEIIENCIRTAGTAPSGANHQPWHFALIRSADAKKQVREAAEIEERKFYDARRAGEDWLDALADLGTDSSKPYLETAPWTIAIFGQRRGGVEVGMDLKNYYVPESVGIATGFLISALHNAGLATLTHTPKPMGFINKICGRPDNEKPYILLVVGYPAEGASYPKHSAIKKSLADITSII